MPTRAPRPCLVCGTPTGSNRCPAHRARPQRPSTAARGYDSQWRQLVAQAKRRQRALHGEVFCTDCGLTEQQATATGNPLTGDHLRWPARTVDDIEVVCRRDNARRGARRTSVTDPVAVPIYSG